MKASKTEEFEVRWEKSRWHLAALVGLSLIGVAVVLFQTRFGPGTGGDSTSYLMGAENLLTGNGFSRFSGGFEIRPITGFPPFYSIALAGLKLFGMASMAAARWLNAFLFGFNLLLAAGLVYQRSRSPIAALLAGLLLLLTEELVHWHSWVMSEPLFIGLMLAGIWLVLSSNQRQEFGLPAAAGLLFGLATLTRYAGISLLAAALFVFIVVDRKEWRRSLLRSSLLVGVGAAVIGAWMLRNTSAAGTAVNREIIYHGIDPDLLRLYLAEVSSWFIPHELPLPTWFRASLAVLLAAAILGFFLRAAWRGGALNWARIRLTTKDDQTGSLPWLLLAFMTAYSAVLALNSLLLDASTSPPAVPRYLTPLYVALVIFSFAEVGRSLRIQHRVRARILVLGYLAVLIVFAGANTGSLLAQPLTRLGYTGNRIQWEELVTTLQGVELDRPILSNNPELVYILAGRPAYVRPIQFDHYQEQFRDDFEQQLEAAGEKLQAGGLLVIFKPVEPIDEQVIEYTGAVRLADFEQAVVFGYEGALSLRLPSKDLTASRLH